MTALPTVARLLADAFARRGVGRVFGVPGGGSSLDLIRACHERALPFVLARSETAAVIMAAVTAELTGTLGVALVTQGPGAASAANGVAYASLDRAPLMLISDGWDDQQSFDSHQRFDQPALLGPLIKAHDRLEGDAAAIAQLIDKALAPPQGPVYVELTGENARRQSAGRAADGARDPVSGPGLDAGAVVQARALLARSSKPVVLAGLEARAAAGAVRAFADALGCPVLTTYKAKGVIADDDPKRVGLFTGAAAERACVEAADLIVMVGLDPVELIGRPWPYAAPVLEIAAAPRSRVFVVPAVSLRGPLAASIAAVQGGGRTAWAADEIRGFRDAMAARLAYRGTGRGLSPAAVVADAAALAQGARVTVDAGAHMVCATTLWPAQQPGDLSISNGLSTMGFALPAALAVSLADPRRPVIAFTGDGGLMMCLGELSSLVQEKARVCVVVFNDGALSLIELKQRARRLPREGVGWPTADFAAIARGFGITAWSVETAGQYRDALHAALDHAGPTLIDVAIDPSGYGDQLAALRSRT